MEMRMSGLKSVKEFTERYVENDFIDYYIKYSKLPPLFILSDYAYLTFFQGSNIDSQGIRYQYITLYFNLGKRINGRFHFTNLKKWKLKSVKPQTMLENGINREFIMSLTNTYSGFIPDECKQSINESFDIYEEIAK